MGRKISKKRKGPIGGIFIRYISLFFIFEAVCLIVFGIIMPIFMSGSWEDEQKQKLYEYTLNISKEYCNYAEADASDKTVTAARLVYAIENVVSMTDADIYITDTAGNLVFCNHTELIDGTSPRAVNCDEHSGVRIPGEITTGILAEGILATISDLGGIFEDEMFISASASRKDFTDKAHGIVLAVQGYDKGLESYRTNFVQIYILSAFAFIVITCGCVYWLTSSLTKPLRKMSEATKRYSKGDFSYRIDRNDRDMVREFDELSAAMNSMAENLERLESSRSDFVANVSHELKTPMTTIGGFIDGILDGTIEGEQRDYYLRIVSDEVKRLSRLVVSMLNMTKMESGEFRIQPSDLNITQQIVGIFISFEQKINDKKINIKGLDSLSNVYISADRDMINQVFYNLIDNAVKFTDHGGEISVIMTYDDENVTVKLRNTGNAISSKDIDHIFERFYKVDKSRSLDSKSAGLGLFIVKQIVELHNGEISVSNIDDKYTQFTVKLKIKLID